MNKIYLFFISDNNGFRSRSTTLKIRNYSGQPQGIAPT